MTARKITTAGYIVAYLESKGFTRNAAAGIVGNAEQESSLNPATAGGGLFQDIGSRAASGTGTGLEQLNKMIGELTTSEKGTLAKIQAANSPAAAARIFSEDFERPSEPDLSNRESYAQTAYLEPRVALTGGGKNLPATIDAGFLEYIAPGLGGPVERLLGEGKTTSPAESLKKLEENPLGENPTVKAVAGSNPFAILEDLTNPLVWVRIGEGLVGIVLILSALKTLSRKYETSRTIVGQSKEGAVSARTGVHHVKTARKVAKKAAEAA